MLDLDRYRQIDHAYAVTIHKSQGATVEHSILFAMVKPEKERTRQRGPELSPGEQHYGRTSYNALNVAVTRAQFETHVFTNSIEGLARSVEMVDEKSSALRKIVGPEQTLDRRLPGRGMDVAASRRELGVEIRKLERMVRAPVKRSLGLNLENIRVRPLSLPRRELQRPLPEIARVQKEVGRQLELVLPRKFGLGMDK